MDIILRHGIKLDQEDTNRLERTHNRSGFTLLMRLILLVDKYPNICPAIKEYCNKFPDEINKINKHGWNALMIALRNSIYDAAKILLECGADLNMRNNAGETALHIVAFNNNYYLIIDLLLKYGADANLIYNERNVLDYILAFKKNICLKKIVKSLLEYDSDHVFYSTRFDILVKNITMLNTRN